MTSNFRIQTIPLATTRASPISRSKNNSEVFEASKDPHRVPRSPHHSTGFYARMPVEPTNPPYSAASSDVDAPKPGENNKVACESPRSPDVSGPPAPIIELGDEALGNSDDQHKKKPRVRRDHHGKRRPYAPHRGAAMELPFAHSAWPGASERRQSSRLRHSIVSGRGASLSPRRSSRLRQ